MIRHSYSRLSQYLRCPLSYKFKYLDKLPDEKSGPLLVGGVCHDFFEAYDRHLIASKRSTDHDAAERILLEVFHRFERPVPPALYDEYRTICLDWVHDHVLDLTHVVGPEVQIAVTRALTVCAWDDEAAWFRFKLDRVDYLPETGRYVITDYKTGWGGGADPFQLLLYAIAVSLMHQQDQEWAARGDLHAVEVVLFYNRSGRAPTWIFSPEQIEQGIEQMIATAERVEQEKEFRPTPGHACTSCAYVAACPARAADLRPVLSQADAQAVAAECLQLSAQAKAREEVLREWCGANGPVAIKGCEFAFGTRERFKVLDPQGFVNAVAAAGEDPTYFYDLSTTKIKKACTKNPNLADAVAPFIGVEVQETFTHKVPAQFDPFNSASGGTDDTRKNEQPAAAEVDAALKLQAPADAEPATAPGCERGAGRRTSSGLRHGLARFGSGDGPRAGDRPAAAGAGDDAPDRGPGRCGPARFEGAGGSEVGQGPGDHQRPGSGGGRRRPF